MSEPTPLDREVLAALIGDVQPASDGLLLSFAESVRNRREHEHPEWEDLYCANLAAYMGERMAPVLRRVIAAETRVRQLEAELQIGDAWTCHVCGKENSRATCLVCETDRPDAEPRTPKWLTDRQARLGNFVQCSASRCSFGEWSSKAEARGWVRRGDGWLCVQCADAADERTEIIARMPAGVPDELTTRRQRLLEAIRRTPTIHWTTGTAAQVYTDLGYPKRGRRHNARADLHVLAALGLVTVHGPDHARYFLLAQPEDGAQ